jgi:hypothetical protein
MVAAARLVLVFLAGAFSTAVLGQNLERPTCPARMDIVAPPAAPSQKSPKSPARSRDASYDPWELVAV